MKQEPNVILIQGDAYEETKRLGMIQDCALVTDPPYVFETSGGGMFRKDRKCMDDIIEAGLDKGFDYQIINPLLYNSAIVFCHNDQLPELLPFMNGLYHRTALCAWHKRNPMPVANKHYIPDTEFYIHAWNRDAHPIGELQDKKRVIIAGNGKSDYDHPTVKPLEVMEKIMKNVNAKTIIDPFAGTGTTGVAAINAGKDFIGIEKNAKYYRIAQERLDEAMRKRKGIPLRGNNVHV